MSVPKLRFPGFDGEWELKELDNISGGSSYGMNAAAIPFDGHNKYIRITDIDEVSRLFTPNPVTSPDGSLSKDYKLQEGDLLFARTGASVGKSYLYKNSDGNLFFAGFLIRFKIDRADPAFVFYSTLTRKYQIWVVKMSMRSGQPGINAKEYGALPISLPSLEEQKKIAGFLSAVDKKIELLSRKKALFENYKKGVMQKLFSQQLRFKDDNGNNFPEWAEKKIVEIAEINMGQSPPSDSYGIEQIGYPLIQGNADIDNRKTSPRQWTTAPTKLCDIGDIILTVRAPVGAVSLSHHNACIGRGVCSIKSSSQVHSIYLYLWFILFENKWDSIAQGSTFTAINRADIESLGTPFPCLEEQKKIADFLSSIDEKIELVGKQIEGMKLYKKGLLQQMFV